MTRPTIHIWEKAGDNKGRRVLIWEADFDSKLHSKKAPKEPKVDPKDKEPKVDPKDDDPKDDDPKE